MRVVTHDGTLGESAFSHPRGSFRVVESSSRRVVEEIPHPRVVSSSRRVAEEILHPRRDPEHPLDDWSTRRLEDCNVARLLDDSATRRLDDSFLDDSFHTRASSSSDNE
jgi:hypothetical protein